MNSNDFNFRHSILNSEYLSHLTPSYWLLKPYIGYVSKKKKKRRINRWAPFSN